MTIATRGQGVGIDPPDSQQSTQVCRLQIYLANLCSKHALIAAPTKADEKSVLYADAQSTGSATIG